MQPDWNHITEGRVTRAIWRLAGPMLASAVLQNVQSLIDLFWVGRLGASAVAALAMSGTLLMLLFPVVLGLATGTVALVSRNVGAGDPGRASDFAGQSLLAAGGIGMATGIAGWLLAPWLTGILGTGDPVASLAVTYLRVSFTGTFTIFLLFVGNSALQGAGNAIVPMRVMILCNLINLVLDPILIFGWFGLPAFGVGGAAASTVVAQFIGMTIVLLVLARGRTGLHITPARCRPRWRLAWRVLRIGMPSSAQMAARSLMALVLMRIVAGCGMAAVAAYGIGVRFHMIILMPAFALGGAAATMVGQNLGAGQPARAQRAAWIASVSDMALMAVSAALLSLAAPYCMGVFTSDAEVIAVGTSMIRIVTPFFVFVALAIVLGRALQGAGSTLPPMIITIICLWGLQVPLAILLSRTVVPATDGIWWANVVAITAHGLLVAAWFQTGRWRRIDN